MLKQQECLGCTHVTVTWRVVTPCYMLRNNFPLKDRQNWKCFHHFPNDSIWQVSMLWRNLHHGTGCSPVKKTWRLTCCTCQEIWLPPRFCHKWHPRVVHSHHCLKPGKPQRGFFNKVVGENPVHRTGEMFHMMQVLNGFWELLMCFY